MAWRQTRAEDARRRAGFTLLEVLIALSILAFALTVITAGASSSAIHSKRIYRSTAAALLLRGTLLDIEEKYRKEGFPTNDLTDRDCELPKVYSKQFKCKYDLLGLNLDESARADMTTQAQTMLAQAQEALAQSGALDQLSGGGGKKDLADLGDAASSAKAAGLDLNALAKGGDMMQLLQVLLLSGEQGMNLLNLCDINISVLQMSMGLMVGELLPRILERATNRTRKVVLKLSWKDEEGEQRQLQIETFTTAVSEEEAQAIQEMKQAEKIQSAIESKLPGGGGR